MITTTDFIEFLDTWAAGQARAVTQGNYEMLAQLTACPEILDDGHCEQLDLPPGSTVGEATSDVLEMLEEWFGETSSMQDEGGNCEEGLFI